MCRDKIDYERILCFSQETHDLNFNIKSFLNKAANIIKP